MCCDCSENGYQFERNLTFAERVKVIDLAAKGKSSRAIALSLGVGKMQIQGILAKKTSIIQSWKAGTNSKIQYLAVRKSNNGNRIVSS